MEGAWSYYNAGDYENSIEYGKQALSCAMEAGHKDGEEEAYRVLTWSYYWTGDYEKSIEKGIQALSAAKETGNKEREADGYDVLAKSYYMAGHYEKSIEQGKQALSAAKETGNKEREADAYDVLAKSYYIAGDYEKSIEQGKQLLSAAKETGNKEWKGKACDVLAESYYLAGENEKSIEQGKQLLSAAKETGNKEWEAKAYYVLAKSYYFTGDYEKSIEHGKPALSAAKKTGNGVSEAEAYEVLAWSYYMAGYYDKSIEQGKQLLSAAKETGSKEREASAHDVLAKSYHGLGDHIQAVRPGYRPGTKHIYKMTASPRGLAIIVNNKKFENHPDVSERPKTRHGSQEDVRQVKELFTDLGFTVETEENLKKEDLLDKVRGFANKAERAHDCFVLWLMSHGSSGMLTCAEGKTVSIQSLQDQVIKTGKLEDKPKLFFIQACRGYDKHQISLPEQQSTVRHTKSTTETDTSALQKPSSADFLFSYSTVDDYVSYRDPNTGSYFVTALVKVFRQYAAVDDLDSMLIKVNDKVSEMVIQEDESGDKCFKQMPEFTNTLTKKLYF